MAEAKVNDLPVMSSSDFTDNDLFLMLDNGKARLLTRPTFQAWMRENVKGEKGDTGSAGKDGLDGRNGTNGVNGINGISAYQVAVGTGFIGTETEWVTSLKGDQGLAGVDGSEGWSPVLSTAQRGVDVVIQLRDWVGGTGSKPTTLGYLSNDGIVTNIANATNIRGDKGLTGDRGIQGETGANGADGSTIETAVFNGNGSITLNMTDSTTVTSNAPPRASGWASYKDSVYIDTNPLVIPATTQVVLPNNGLTVLSNFPTGVITFYNNVSQKMVLADQVGSYTIRVRFKVKPVTTSTQEFINISYSKETTEVPFSQDIPLRGDNQVQDVNVSTEIYGDASIVANGISARIRTSTSEIQIYNVEFVIVKVS